MDDKEEKRLMDFGDKLNKDLMATMNKNIKDLSNLEKKAKPVKKKCKKNKKNS